MNPAKYLILFLLLSVGPAGTCIADPLDDYLTRFDYQERQAMKIDSKGLLKMLAAGDAQLIDIRFAEEFAVWHMGFAKNIPLNELPARLGELDRSKVIVTACPHKDRAAQARMYLAAKGYTAKYLKDGLLGLAETLRGETARDFCLAMPKQADRNE